MDRFKRFLGKFTLYFGAYVLISAVCIGVSAGVAYLNSVFGPVAGVMVAVAIFGALVSGGVAWISSYRPKCRPADSRHTVKEHLPCLE